MTLADTVQFWGNSYTAVAYHGRPADFLPTDDHDDDPQCRICSLEPNYCHKQVPKDDCHGPQAFIFIKTEYFKRMFQNQDSLP